MGCRCCFVLNQLEELVDAGDPRSSSRVREHESFCLFHNCMWQSRHSEVNVYFLALCEQTDGLFTFNGSHRSSMISVYVFVCVFVLIWTFNRHWHTTGKHVSLFFHWCFRSQVRHVFDFLSTRTGWLLCQNRSSCSNSWIFGFWLGLLEFSPSPATSEPNSFIQLSSKEIFGGGWGDAKTFSKMTSPDFIMIAFGIPKAGSVS